MMQFTTQTHNKLIRVNPPNISHAFFVLALDTKNSFKLRTETNLHINHLKLNALENFDKNQSQKGKRKDC